MTNQIERLMPEIARTAEQISQQYKRLVLFCSGGVDSTVLCQLFCEKLKLQKKIEIELAHVNFMLRGIDSDADERFVKDLAERWSLPFRLIRANECQPLKGSIQEWARTIRQDFINCVNKEQGIAVLAHHADDTAETALFRLARGSSSGTLRGMQALDERVWRPLLSIPKSTLIAYAQAEMIHHRHDASNDKLIYSRNQIRHEVLPRLELLFAGASSRIVECVNDAADVQAEAVRCLKLERINQSTTHGCLNSWLASKSTGVALLAIASMINEQNANTVALSREILLKILQKLRDNEQNWVLQLPGHLEWVSKEGRSRVRAQSKGTKKIRAAQHQTFLKTSSFAALVPERSKVVVATMIEASVTMRTEFFNDSDSAKIQDLKVL